MAQELSYILVTPYTIAKSRTGGVIARLLSRVDLEFVGAQLFAPTAEFAQEYAASVAATYEGSAPRGGELMHDYILRSFSPSGGRKHRVLMLLFRGKDAFKQLSDIAGPLYSEEVHLESITGETIRDTYADFVTSPEDPKKVVYYEPAVLTPRTRETARIHMKMIMDFIRDEPTVIENMIYPDPDKIERTLVIIKPDNWRFASSRPGTIIDMFSRTGLRIISCKVQQMSLSQALEFYGPVRDVLKKKLSPIYGRKAKDVLEREFDVVCSDDVLQSLTSSLGEELALDQFYQIVEFMTGRRPDTCPVDEYDYPGTVKSMVLIYEGKDAVNKIREVLGPTDPTKAPGGTVRREFGQNIMVNTAHASDAPENAVREMKVVRINENSCYSIMKNYLEQ
ncbi:MAG: nucleoside-diphosphate kinase [Spirochaetia bacterium]|nr:nucleoside-diphosphate kinase [Spirochaetia bacterium]